MLSEVLLLARENSDAAKGRPQCVSVRSFENRLAPQWDQFAIQSRTGSFFHMTPWMNIIQKTFGFASSSFYSERNGRITGILPLFRVKNWVAGHCLISSPFSVSGGICAEDQESETALLRRAQELAHELNVDYLELRSEQGVPYPDFCANSLYSTFTKDLSPDVESNFKKLPTDTRYMVRRATRAGLAARHGLDQIDVFFRLFAMNMHHHGTPMFPRSLFSNIENCVESQKLDLLIIYSGKEPVSGVLSFFHGDTVLPYYAGLGPKGHKLAANNFMYWELMKFAAEAGYRRFDFGRSKRDTGAYFFKSQWNMEIQLLNYQVYLVRRKDQPNLNPLNPKFKLATRMWQKLPLWGANLLGPHILKWFP